MDKDPSTVLARKPSYLKITLQIGVIAILIALIAYIMRRNVGDILDIRNLSVPYILLTGAALFASYISYASAVFVVLGQLGLKSLALPGWLRIYFASRVVNFFVMQGGNVFRLVILKKKFGFSYTNSIGITAFLIWINALIALFTAISILASSVKISGFESTRIIDAVLLAASILVVGPMVFVWFIRNTKKSSIWDLRAFKPFIDIADFFSSTAQNVGLLSRIALLSALHFLCFAAVNYFSFIAIGQQVGLVVVFFYTSAYVFTRYINVVPGNLGVSELAGGLIAEQLGIGFSHGVLASAVIRIAELLVVGTIGLSLANTIAIGSIRK